MMKCAAFVLFLSMGFLPARGQKHEITAGIGIAQYYGDLNIVNSGPYPWALVTDGMDRKNYQPSFTVGYRFHFPKYYSLGVHLTHLKIRGSDADNRSSSVGDAAYYRLVRNLSFHSNVEELTLDFRYEPFRNPAIWYNAHWFLSPYAGLGLGIFHFNPRAIYQNEEIDLQPLGTEGQGYAGYGTRYSLFQLSIPFSIGFKVNDPSRKFAIGLDLTYHFTTTDYLDDVSTVYPDPAIYTGTAGQVDLAKALSNRNLYGTNDYMTSGITAPGEQRGNPRNKDHFFTAQIRISYYIGKSMKGYAACQSF